ncbi:MAG: hypothetical protein HQM08_15415 [Candidatus Riflebacteria bacterium]|nr:hypothetical protein [Candidatus Riflebacteria bacterium]
MDNSPVKEIKLIENANLSIEQFENLVKEQKLIVSSEKDLKIGIWKSWIYIFEIISAIIEKRTPKNTEDLLLAEGSAISDVESLKANLIRGVFLIWIDNEVEGQKTGFFGIISNLIKFVMGKGSFYSNIFKSELAVEKIEFLMKTSNQDFREKSIEILERRLNEIPFFQKNGFFIGYDAILVCLSLFRWLTAASAHLRNSGQIDLEDLFFAEKKIDSFFATENSPLQRALSNRFFSMTFLSLATRKNIVGSIISQF